MKKGQTRKDLRKQKRQDKKRVPTKAAKSGPLSKILGGASRSAEVVSKKAVEATNEAGRQNKETKLKKLKSFHSTSFDTKVDPMIAAEEKELERLEKLLGFKRKNKKKSKKGEGEYDNDDGDENGSTKSRFSERMNKEFSMYHGLGEDMGDFLMELDEIGKRDPSKIPQDNAYDIDAPEEGASQFKEHIIEDGEQEPDDMDEDVYSDTEDEEEEEEEEEKMENKTNDMESDTSDEGNEVKFEEDEGEDGSTNGGVKEVEEAIELGVYRPVIGEDIYGRSKETSEKPQTTAYVPPARRKLTVIDESSEGVQMVRKQMNGLMNRLSEQSRDTILRSLKGIFDTNSSSVCCTILKDLIMSGCANPTQMMTSLIPVYASMIAALHYAVGVDVGAFIIEHLTSKLHSQVLELHENRAEVDGAHPLLTSKLPNNCLLLMIYLYGVRILHHELVVDITHFLSQLRDDEGKLGEKQVELLLCVVDGCGQQLRSDDPVKLREIINSLSLEGEMRQSDGSTRVKHLLSSLTDLKNNKSKRQESTVVTEIKKMRKWLGGLKTTFASSTKNYVLRVSLSDLLNAENKGRWWRAGASWMGREDKINHGGVEEDVGYGKDDQKEDNTYNAEEQMMLKIATKMRLNTDIRKRIFLVMMSSRDVADAFERLTRLDLKGRQDREVVRVLVECCGQEREYNSFYPELAGIMCSQNRQFKTTLQFCLWDLLKGLATGDVAERRVINLARMFAHLVASFHLPLSVLKPVDISELPNEIVLFLATFFMALFGSEIPDDTFQSIFDRVASTKDFAAVKGVVLFFLNKHFTDPPKGLGEAEAKQIKKRRKKAIKALQSLDVLEYAPGRDD